MIGFFDLSDRVKLRVSGPDRIRYLNGQVTNDVRKAHDRVLEACFLNAKGKSEAHVFIRSSDNALWLDADRAQGGNLLLRLERFAIADDVTFEDLSEQFGLLHVLGNGSAIAREMKGKASRRFLKDGWDVWVPSAEIPVISKRLSATLPAVTAESMEHFRIECGLPRWGFELGNEIIPVEANLADRCIDYAKGCYIGQEVISRMKMSGQTNKRLCGFVALEGKALTAGMRLFPLVGEKEAGWITSATRSDEFGEIALGYARRGFESTGTQLRALLPAESDTGSPAIVRVTDIPFSVVAK